MQNPCNSCASKNKTARRIIITLRVSYTYMYIIILRNINIIFYFTLLKVFLPFRDIACISIFPYIYIALYYNIIYIGTRIIYYYIPGTCMKQRKVFIPWQRVRVDMQYTHSVYGKYVFFGHIFSSNNFYEHHTWYLRIYLHDVIHL